MHAGLIYSFAHLGTQDYTADPSNWAGPSVNTQQVNFMIRQVVPDRGSLVRPFQRQQLHDLHRAHQAPEQLQAPQLQPHQALQPRFTTILARLLVARLRPGNQRPLCSPT